MKNQGLTIGFLLMAFILIGCQSPTTQQKINTLNGYWEIFKVKDSTGQVRKVYKMNPSVDYIHIDSTRRGYRVKLKPSIDGSYKTTGDRTHFTVKVKQDSIKFLYHTPMTQWIATLLTIEEDRFTVRGQRNMIYVYKRFKGLKEKLKAHAHAKEQ